MKILSVAFSIEGDTRIMKGDALEHEGRLWLVVQWLGNPAEGPAKPRRLIELDQFQLQRFAQTTQFGNGAVGHPIPKRLLDFPIPSQLAGKFVVLEEPDLTVLRSEVQKTVH
jgi:hypothetical protein